MKISCKYEQTSQILTLYFPDDFDSSNQFTSSHIADESVGDAKIDRTTDPIVILTADLNDALITTAKIANLAVDNTKLAELAVTAGKIVGGATQGAAKVDDDCADDDTGNWSIAVDAVNSTITFDTDHYELSSNGDANEIFYVGSLSLTQNNAYYFQLDVKDGTESSEHIQLVSLNGTTVEDVANYTTSSSFTTITHYFKATANTDGVGIRVPADLAGDDIEIQNVTLYNVTEGVITETKIGVAAIGAGAIGKLAVGSAQIADAAIVTAKIGDLQVNNAKISDLDGSKITVGTLNVIGDTGGTAYVQITGGGLVGYTNSTKLLELTSAGLVYIGDQSNEHIKLSISGLQVYDGAKCLATYGATTNFYDTNGTERLGVGTSGAFIGNSTEGEYVFIDSTNGIRIFGNATLTGQWKNDGTAYIGDQSNEHIKLSTSGLEIKDGATVLATYGSNITVGQVAASQNNILISSGAIYLRNNTTNIFSITNAGVSTLNMLANSSIILAGHGSTPGKIVFDGTSNDLLLYTDANGTASHIVAESSSGSPVLYIGSISVQTFQTIELNSYTNTLVRAYYDSDDYASILLAAGDNSSQITFYINRNGSAESFTFDDVYDHLNP